MIDILRTLLIVKMMVQHLANMAAEERLAEARAYRGEGI